VPRSILYDNLRLAVARILGDGRRLRTRVFSELQSHYLFADRFGRPGKGNDKGKVEGLVGYARRNFMVPVPHATSFAELNARLLECCCRRFKREFVQVLRLLEVFRTNDVSAAVREASGRGVLSFDAVRHLVLCRIERRPPRLDLKIYPYLPRAMVVTT
jgi:hypothetical protein